MKKTLLLLLASISLTLSAVAQSTTAVFWTRNTNYGDIRVYVNGSYAGTITRAYSSAPDCYAPGCVTVTITRSRNTWRAEGEDGSTWGSRPAPISSNCNHIELYGTSTSSTRGSTSSGSDVWSDIFDDVDGEAAVALAMVVAAGAAAVGTAYASNDVYANWVTASDYNGFNFGFKNTMSRRLDVEMGAGVYTDREPTGWDKPKPKWAYDLNAVYNILPRYSTINPYVGIATTTMPEFGLGGLVGVSAGFWENRVQLHARYKWIKDFDFNHRLANQFEIGISVKYKHGWNFEDQDFRYHDEDDYAPTRFGVQAGVVFASTNAEEAKARTGYNIMFNMAFDIDDTPWAINWGMIGINSRGWKTGNRQTILYYMSPAALNASYRVELGYAGLAALPFAGFQCDLLLNNKRNSIGYDRLRQFDFSPVLGAALQVNRAVEVGAQYNYGMVSIAKQSDIRHRDLQLFTRLFF